MEENPKGTHQQKGVSVQGGRPHFYEKGNIRALRQTYHHKIFKYLYERKIQLEKLSGPVKVSILFNFSIKDKKKWGKYKPTVPDVDNIAKEFVDSMKAVGYFVDDAVVVDLRVIKSYAEQASIMVQYEVIEQ